MNNLEWYVYRYDFNRKEIYHYNIFDHWGFFEDCCRAYKKYKKDIPQFIEEVRKNLMYYMWSKYEYEVVVSELSTTQNPAEIKVDAYAQVKMNWKHFENYILANLDKFKIKKENK